MSQIKVKVNKRGFRALSREPWVRDRLLEIARPVVRDARRLAPKRTGAGARSIHAEAVLGRKGWEVRISWDRAHAYMRFQKSHAIQDALRSRFGG